MRALLCRENGGIESLSLEDVPDPRVAHDQVIVDVKAAALNFPDTLIVAGKYQIQPELPFIVGGEAAGVVSAVGESVSHYAVGDRVAAVGSTGAFAQKMQKHPSELLPLPAAMPFAIAAGFSVAYGTSYYALKQCAKISAGDTVLVLGAAGGVGLAAVDISRALGATVIAAASSDDKLKIAEQLGAKHVINYSSEPLKERVKEITGGTGVDVVYDPVGGELSESALRATAWNGRFLVVGFAAGDIPRMPLNLPLLKNCCICGVFFGAWAQRDPDAYLQNYSELFEMYESGKLQPQVHAQYDLENFAAAFSALTERKVCGKVIIDIDSSSS